MISLLCARYAVRTAECDSDIAGAQSLRRRAFRDGKGTGPDVDGFDRLCTHFLVEDRSTGRLAACWRILPVSRPAGIEATYAAQFYDLERLGAFPGRMIEVGRFCLDPAAGDPEVLRLAWAALTAYVDKFGVDLLFGCSSFAGTDPDRYADAFALLADRHLAPARWRPGTKSPEVVAFGKGRAPDLEKGLRAIPPLLRTYLMMGGWVSDHAVVDRDLGTLHVFTGVEVAKVPVARARALRSAVSQLSWVKADGAALT